MPLRRTSNSTAIAGSTNVKSVFASSFFFLLGTRLQQSQQHQHQQILVRRRRRIEGRIYHRQTEHPPGVEMVAFTNFTQERCGFFAMYALCWDLSDTVHFSADFDVDIHQWSVMRRSRCSPNLNLSRIHFTVEFPCAQNRAKLPREICSEVQKFPLSLSLTYPQFCHIRPTSPNYRFFGRSGSDNRVRSYFNNCVELSDDDDDGGKRRRREKAGRNCTIHEVGTEAAVCLVVALGSFSSWGL